MRSPILAVVSSIAMLSCGPTQNDPVRYGVVKVWIAPGWISYDTGRIRDAMRTLQRLGPVFIETTIESEADVTVHRFKSSDCTLDGAGGWIVGSTRVEVDPVCAAGDDAFRSIVSHEVGHAVGMQHVCRFAGESTFCSPVGYGDAVMNPTIRTDDAVPDDVPTELDLAEFRRVYRK